MLTCPCCGLTTTEEELELYYPGEFDGLQCPECGALFVDTECVSEIIEKAEESSVEGNEYLVTEYETL